ncbi:MAG: hypothetical protein GX982_05265, partial [Tissierellia bacterium]|nr:hypothetical protein [Tissierellia bacterium]
LLGLLSIYVLLILKSNYNDKLREEEIVDIEYEKLNKQDTSEIPLIREREIK